jgi:hypothetical protein
MDNVGNLEFSIVTYMVSGGVVPPVEAYKLVNVMRSGSLHRSMNHSVGYDLHREVRWRAQAPHVRYLAQAPPSGDKSLEAITPGFNLSM